MHEVSLEEEDLALVHALQVAPRISWAAAGRVLGAAPATLAGRWRRLHGEGLAWVTVHPGEDTRRYTVGFVDVDCAPGARRAVSRTLCEDARVVSIDESAAGRDLLLTVIVRDLGELTRFALDDLTSLPGVLRQRTSLATALHRQGSRWRLDALESSQQAALEEASRPAPHRTAPPANAWPLIEALARDGRSSAAEVAQLTGRNPATVRRQLSRLIASDTFTFRCEVARGHAGWPISCSWFAHVPAAELDRTVQALMTLPGLRLCASTTGGTNLTFSVGARSLGDLPVFERRLGERLPWMELRESVPHLRTVKRMGWILDEDGRSTGRVVVPTVFRPSA